MMSGCGGECMLLCIQIENKSFGFVLLAVFEYFAIGDKQEL